MNLEGNPVVTVHVTGFKKFGGCSYNPTEKIVNSLRDYFVKKGFPNGVLLGTCTVLDVAGEGALDPLYNILEQSIAMKDVQDSEPGNVIWLHLGVDGGAAWFSLERQAVNEATFCVPDELGWMPMWRKVIPADGSISCVRETVLPLGDITLALIREGYNVRTSDDAGLFVCNYVYYHSLSFAEKHGVKSLFVHVPPFEAIDEETQMRFVGSLLQVLASLQQS